jgi:DNA-binding MarR family transcriptional regulator
MDYRKRIGFEVRTLSNLIHRTFENDKTIRDVNKLTGMHSFVIKYLYDNHNKKDIFQRDLETDFSIRRSTATGILQLMEKNGLITREPVEYDARLKKLVLTQKAIAIHQSIEKEIMQIEAQLTKGITEEEINNFLAVMEKLKKNME